MDTSFAERLIGRARTMLPAATMMCLECAGDETGSEELADLLAELQARGLEGRDLCEEPWEPVLFEDRVLLRCHGCARLSRLPQIEAAGHGRTEAEARRNALYALTLPLDRATVRRRGFPVRVEWGEGPVTVTETACVINRVAYETVTA